MEEPVVLVDPVRLVELVGLGQQVGLIGSSDWYVQELGLEKPVELLGLV